MPVAADDQMVVDADAHRFRDDRDLLRHPYVGVRRGRVAGRMIVRHATYLSIYMKIKSFFG